MREVENKGGRTVWISVNVSHVPIIYDNFSGSYFVYYVCFLHIVNLYIHLSPSLCSLAVRGGWNREGKRK